MRQLQVEPVKQVKVGILIDPAYRGGEGVGQRGMNSDPINQRAFEAIGSTDARRRPKYMNHEAFSKEAHDNPPRRLTISTGFGGPFGSDEADTGQRFDRAGNFVSTPVSKRIRPY